MTLPREQRGRPSGGGSPATAEFSEDTAVVHAMYRELEEGNARALTRRVDTRIDKTAPP